MRKLSVDHLHGIKFLNKADVDLIFDTALNFKEVINRPIKKVPTTRNVKIKRVIVATRNTPVGDRRDAPNIRKRATGR